ncbi:hypothetical protein ACX80H_08875 [Arthrobacter sp. MDT2-2]
MSPLRFLTPLAIAATLLVSANSASAAAPERLGPFEDFGTFEIDCGSFKASGFGDISTRFTRFTDSEGNITKIQQFVSAPADTWVNLSTQKTIVIRGRFIQTWDAATGDLTIVGFRYLVNERGEGVTIQEVGRIVYTDRTEQEVISMAGQHELYRAELIDPAICSALQ